MTTLALFRYDGESATVVVPLGLHGLAAVRWAVFEAWGVILDRHRVFVRGQRVYGGGETDPLLFDFPDLQGARIAEDEDHGGGLGGLGKRSSAMASDAEVLFGDLAESDYCFGHGPGPVPVLLLLPAARVPRRTALRPFPWPTRDDLEKAKAESQKRLEQRNRSLQISYIFESLFEKQQQEDEKKKKNSDERKKKKE